MSRADIGRSLSGQLGAVSGNELTWVSAGSSTQYHIEFLLLQRVTTWLDLWSN